MTKKQPLPVSPRYTIMNLQNHHQKISAERRGRLLRKVEVTKVTKASFPNYFVAVPIILAVLGACTVYPLVFSMVVDFSPQDQELMEHFISRQLSTVLLLATTPPPPQDALSPTMVITASSGRRDEETSCQCELVSVDCLDSIRCLPANPVQSRQAMVLGIYTRKSIRNSSTFAGKAYSEANRPLGKAAQYRAVESWKTWTQHNILPLSYEDDKVMFINESYYPFCIQHGLKGKNCFFTPNNETEELDDLEKDAMESVHPSQELKATIAQDVDEYRHKNKQDKNSVPALGQLLAMAHILRILFNRQPPVREFCKERRKKLHAERLSTTPGQYPLRVSLHMRRADACGHEHNTTKYERHASPLDSPSQNTARRKCYHTSVYMNALQRVERYIQEASPFRPIEVYLSTDHAGSVMAEIERDFADVFTTKAAWHVLDYDREIFNYQRAIELSDSENYAFLGESAIADLWHLSHGEIFIGHLGSRFGKVGWLLATARYNRFVPFFSVDGHSYCCEVDEACGEMKPYIRSMENCMTFSHEIRGVAHGPEYWSASGSVARKNAVLAGTA